MRLAGTVLKAKTMIFAFTTVLDKIKDYWKLQMFQGGRVDLGFTLGDGSGRLRSQCWESHNTFGVLYFILPTPKKVIDKGFVHKLVL